MGGGGRHENIGILLLYKDCHDRISSQRKTWWLLYIDLTMEKGHSNITIVIKAIHEEAFPDSHYGVLIELTKGHSFRDQVAVVTSSKQGRVEL